MAQEEKIRGPSTDWNGGRRDCQDWTGTGLGLDHWARQQGCHEPDATRPWMACQHSRTDRQLLFFLQSSAAAGDDGGEAEKIPEPTGLQGLRARMAVEWLLWRGMQEIITPVRRTAVVIPRLQG